jgi:hypothetical protein
MKYWYSLLLVSSWLVVLTLAGRGLARLLAGRLQPLARLFLAPVLGLALYIILATGVGWLMGARPWVTVGVTLLVSMISLRFEKDWQGFGLVMIWQLAVGVLVSFGVLASVIHCGGYDVFNDTFTYLVHAQWLQKHSFLTPAAPTALEPVYTQVSLYQTLGLRMGASFFLAWVQASSPFEWSIDVYPAVVALALTSGALAIGGLIEALVPGNRRIALAWSVAAGTAVGGFSNGALTGFLPQTCGLALVPALLALLTGFRPPPAGQGRRMLAVVLPLAVIVSAIGFAYSELLPLVCISVLGWFIISVITGRRLAGGWVRAAVVFVVVIAVIWNAECLRIYRALGTQTKALTGWPVPWSLVEFLGFATGFRSGSGDGNGWLITTPAIARTLLPVILSLLAALPLVSYLRQPRHLLRWTASVVFVGLCLAGVCYFRYATPSPWPIGTGQTWNQFKLFTWLSPVLLALSGAGAAVFARSPRAVGVWACLLGGWTIASLHANNQLAGPRVAEVLLQTGYAHDPFAAYRQLRALVHATDPRGPVYLDLGGPDAKSRQMVAYFLHDYPVAADWSDDVYIYPWLPAGWQKISPADCRWWIHRAALAEKVSPRGPALRVGALELSPIPEFVATREAVSGGHGIESDTSGWWVWTASRLVARFRIRSALPTRVRLRFQYLGANLPRTMTVSLLDGANERKEAIILQPGWQNWASASFTAVDAELAIQFSSPEPPVRIGPSDSRLAAFLVKNVRLEPIDLP